MDANQVERQRWNDPFWSEVWPKRERMTESVTPLLMAALALKPGERVLDIGCGGGPATSAAAALVGKSGKAVGADISAPLVTLARSRAAASGAANLSYQLRDAQQEQIEGAPFDVAMSQFGVMFFDEPRAAFSNIRAHLAPSGRLAFVCWQTVAKNPWFIGPALAKLAPPPTPPAPGKSPTGPFAFADPNHVRNILEGAGFAGVAFANHDYTIEVPEDSMIDDGQLVFIGVPREKMPEARAAVDKLLAPFRQPSGNCRIPLAVQVVTARNAS